MDARELTDVCIQGEELYTSWAHLCRALTRQLIELLRAIDSHASGIPGLVVVASRRRLHRVPRQTLKMEELINATTDSSGPHSHPVHPG